MVPLILDAPGKTMWYGDPIHLTGNARKDMDQLRAAYKKHGHGYKPANESAIRIKEEDEAPK